MPVRSRLPHSVSSALLLVPLVPVLPSVPPSLAPLSSTKPFRTRPPAISRYVSIWNLNSDVVFSAPKHDFASPHISAPLPLRCSNSAKISVSAVTIFNRRIHHCRSAPGISPSFSPPVPPGRRHLAVREASSRRISASPVSRLRPQLLTCPAGTPSNLFPTLPLPTVKISFIRKIFSPTSPSFPPDSQKMPANPASTRLDKLIDENQILVFSKTWCHYCRASKRLLASKGVSFHTVELDEDSDGNDLQTALQKKTGQRTVPSIFINGQHVGGSSDLQELEQSRNLDRLLRNAKAS